MIEILFGGRTAEKVLLYLANYGEGYAQGMAKNFNESLYSYQKQLLKLERAGILVSQLKGKTRLFSWNPRYPLKKELVLLLERALDFLPENERKNYFRNRTRPRKTKKPL